LAKKLKVHGERKNGGLFIFIEKINNFMVTLLGMYDYFSEDELFADCKSYGGLFFIEKTLPQALV